MQGRTVALLCAEFCIQRSISITRVRVCEARFPGQKRSVSRDRFIALLLRLAAQHGTMPQRSIERHCGTYGSVRHLMAGNYPRTPVEKSGETHLMLG